MVAWTNSSAKIRQCEVLSYDSSNAVIAIDGTFLIVKTSSVYTNQTCTDSLKTLKEK